MSLTKCSAGTTRKFPFAVNTAIELKKTSSVYDCTVEDVEYICNSCCYNVSIVTHSRHLVVVMLRCCARRRDGALERLRGDVIDFLTNPPT